MADKKIKVTLVKSPIGAIPKHKATVTALGLKKVNKTVVFDRGGFVYTGKIAALADAAREAGLEF